MSSTNSVQLVCLEGSPSEVGRAFGQTNGSDIASEVKRFYETVEKTERIRRRDLIRAGKHYLELVRHYAPHWFKEAEALAVAAGVDAELYMTYQGAKYRGINRPECFSYYSSPANNEGRVTLLHKNRDNVARPQCAHLKGIEVAGRRIFRFMANGDTSDMGTMMALNEMGLAIVADTGAPDPHPRQLGMMNTDTMRIIAESAADVDEALELFREFQKNRVYAGGKIGTNWLLADRRGRGLRLYQFHEALLEKRPEDGLLVMRDEDARGILVKKALSGRRGRITAGLFNKLSRQKPVLAPSNISAYTAVIPAEQTEIFSYAYFALGQAGKTLYVPLYMGVQATPRSLVNGSFFRLSTTHPFGENLFERCQAYKIDLDEFEQDMEEDRANMESVARHVLQREGQDAARRILTEGCMRFARRVEHTLRHLCIER